MSGMRLLAAAHRYLGTAFCIVLFAWFASGIVMMYAGYPALSERIKLDGTRPLDWSRAQLSVADAFRARAAASNVDHVRLGMIRDRPAYFLHSPRDGWKAVYADDGSSPDGVEVERARQIATGFQGGGSAPRLVTLLESPDQWTIYTEWAPYLPSHQFEPTYRFAFDDSPGTVVYVLRSTGDVTQRTTQRARLWGSLGAVVHWIYPTILRAQHSTAWHNIIVWASGAGVLLCVVGLVLGVWYMRWPGGRRRAGSPYRGWLAWHHYLGLAFGVTACTWLFSGLLSMDPWSWSQTDDYPSDAHQAIMRGGDLVPERFVRPPQDALGACRDVINVKEIRLIQFSGAPYYLCVENPYRTRLVAADASSGPFETFETEALVAGARDIVPNATVAEASLLNDYDAYYYPQWRDKVVDAGMKRLPVLRLVFADPQRTLIYVDPSSATPVLAYGRSARVYRWLFHGLHSLDFPGLYLSRPMWDVVMLPLMLGGAVLSFTGIWVGVTWLSRTLRHRPSGTDTANGKRRRRAA